MNFDPRVSSDIPPDRNPKTTFPGWNEPGNRDFQGGGVWCGGENGKKKMERRENPKITLVRFPQSFVLRKRAFRFSRILF